MKSFFCTLLSILSINVVFSQAQTIGLNPTWETDTTLRTPECVVVDPRTNVLYVACINGNPTPDNKGSYVAKVSQDGKVIQLKFTDNLNSTKGMGILNDKLYVTEMTQVVEIALTTGKILNRYPIPGAKFLNDIAIDARKQIIYVSDYGDNKIWALSQGKATMVLSGMPLNTPNGLLFEADQLLIGNGDGSLLTVNTATKKLDTITKVSSGIDGIVALGNKTYLVTEWGGKIWYVRRDGTSELKLDTTPEKINSADIGYNPATRMLFVPTFFHNTVKAYAVH